MSSKYKSINQNFDRTGGITKEIFMVSAYISSFLPHVTRQFCYVREFGKIKIKKAATDISAF